VTDASQGVQLATMHELARYWEKDYDWCKVEVTLNPCRNSRRTSTRWRFILSTFSPTFPRAMCVNRV